MPLINCNINLILTWSANCVITNSVGIGTFAITDTKLYVSIVTLSAENNAKLPKQLDSGLRCIITWYSPLVKVIMQAQNQYFDFLTDPGFEGVNRFFALLFKNATDKTLHIAKIGNYNVMMNGIYFFDQPVNTDERTNGNIQKITNGQGDDYTPGCHLDYPYFKQHYKMVAIELSKEQVLDVDLKAIQKINSSGNLEEEVMIFFMLEEMKETVAGFF